MASVNKIRVELELADGEFKQRIIRATDAIERLDKGLDKTSRSVKRTERRVRGFGATLRDLTVTLGQARSAFLNIRMVTTDWVGAIIKANAEIERMTFLMRGMSEEVSGFKRTKEAERSVQWIFDLAQKAPFSVGALSDSFVKFRSVGLDPTKGSLESVSDAIAAFGGDDQTLHRASIAIQQMAGKGVISMEELRQQLGEAVPTAINLMARSVNMTYKDLVKKISEGAIEAQSALSNMFAEFNRTFGGRAQSLMKTWNGLVSQLRTRWTLFAAEIGKGGLFSEAKKQLKDLVAVFDDEAIKSFAADFGAALGEGIRMVRAFVEEIYRLRDVILAVGKVVLITFAGRAVAGALASFAAGIATILAGLARMRAAIAAAGIQSFFATMRGGVASMTTFAGATTAAGTALRFAARGFALLAGPVGIAIGVIWTLIDAFTALKGAARESSEEIEGGILGIGDAKKMAQFKRFIEENEESLERLNEMVKEGGSHTLFGGDAGRLEGGYHYGAKEIRKERDRLAAEMKAAKDELEGIALKAIERQAKRQAMDVLETYRDEVDGIRNIYNERANAIADALKKEGTDEEALAKKKVALNKWLYDEQEKVIDKAITEQGRRINTATSMAEVEKIKAVIAGLQALKKEINDGRALGAAASPLQVLEKGADGKLSAIEQKIASLTAMTAKAGAEMKGLGTTVAEVEAMIASGKFAGATSEEIAKLRGVAAGWDAKRASLKAFRDEQKKLANSTVAIGNALTKATSKAKEFALALANPAGTFFSDSYRSQKAQLEKYYQDVVAATKEGAKERLEAEKRVEETLKIIRQNEIRDMAIGLREKTKQIRRGVMTHKEAMRDEYREQVRHLERMLELYEGDAEGRMKLEEIVAEHKKALQEKLEYDTRGPMEKMFENWKDVTERMEEAGARFMDEFVNRMVDGLAEGKMEWGDFAKFVLKELLKIQMRALIAENADAGGLSKIFSSIGGALIGDLGGLFGGPVINNANDQMLQYHKGGIVGMEGEVRNMFASARKFHGGGIVGGRNLGSDEVPTVLKKKEGVFTEGQMRALGDLGNTSVQVNVINSSGTQVEAREEGRRFDGQQMVLDIVLEAAGRPGNFRDNLKGALS